MFLLFDLLFQKFKTYRAIRGGIWMRTSTKAEVGRSIWIRGYMPLLPETLMREWILKGVFDREVYQWDTLLKVWLGQKLCDFVLYVLHCGPKETEDLQFEKDAIALWRRLEEKKKWINDLAWNRQPTSSTSTSVLQTPLG